MSPTPLGRNRGDPAWQAQTTIVGGPSARMLGRDATIMNVGTEPQTMTPPDGPASKHDIVRELGEMALVLPSLVNHALEANERAKYYLTLLQASAASARRPDHAAPTLHGERLAAGINDQSLDQVVASSTAFDDDAFVLPRSGEIHDQLLRAVADMLKPLTAAEIEQPPDPDRLDQLILRTPDFASGLVPYQYVASVTSGDRQEGDSLHLLVMDTHRALNRLQAEIATETLDGASVYGIRDEDRPLVSAFMAGLHRTAPLKFDHPGLGTTATQVAGRLLIQNDIGTTEAHVLVVAVDGPVVTVTYTDVHLARLKFFRSLFDRFDVTWSNTSHRSDAATLGDHHLTIARYDAPDRDALVAYLDHLGSRLVFLIDWNKARKRLTPLVGKKQAIALLRWAAGEDHGHRAFLELGGERLVYTAIEQAMRVPPPYGTPLAEVLGSEATVEVLQFALRTTSRGLLGRKSRRLIRDEIRVELLNHLQAAQGQLLEAVSDHGSLVVETGQVLRTAILRLTGEGGPDFVQRASARANAWEHRADQIVIATRTAAARAPGGEVLAAQITTQDDAIDALEEAVFHLTLLPDGEGPAIRQVLEPLASLAVVAAQEHLKALEIVRLVLDEARPDDIEDFLLAVDRIVELEHSADRADRTARAAIVVAASDFRTLQVATDVSRSIEDSTDALMRSALQLRDRVLAEVITR
jgi:uncharacterized protein Yka (UPF0111/DUF47 family)